MKKRENSETEKIDLVTHPYSYQLNSNHVDPLMLDLNGHIISCMDFDIVWIRVNWWLTRINMCYVCETYVFITECDII